MNEKIWYDANLDQIFFTVFDDGLLSLYLRDGVLLTFDFQDGAVNRMDEINAFFENATHIGML